MSDCDICGKVPGMLRRDLLLVQTLCLCKKCYRDYKEEEAQALIYYYEILSNYSKDEDEGEVYDGYDT